MRTIYKNIYFFMLASVFLFAACDSDDPFAGKDNYITSFSLKQDGKVINATITDDVITIKVPDGTSLNGAVATVTLSENARIYPDPATITEWDDDILFAVTSYSGSQVKYKYTVDRNSIDRKGTVLLETQEDVDAFGESDITAIGGNLIIGRTAGADSIRTLAPLSRLKRIEYSLIIYPTYAAEDFSGLENLETVGDAIQIESVKNVTGFSFQKLKTAGSIYIKNTQILTAEFPQLTSVTKGFTLDCPLKAVSLPKLKTVGEALTFNTANGSMAMLPKLTLPVLENAGKLAVSFFKSTPKVDFPKLKTVGDMSFNQMSLLAFINCPKLETVTGTLTIPSGMALAEVGFPALTEAKNMSIDGKTIKVFDFPKLKTIKGNLILQNVPVNGVADGFPALTAIEGELQLRELPNMVSFTHSPVLKKIGKLSLYNRTTLALKTANIKGLQVGELALQSAAVVINIIGDEEFKGTLTIDPQSFPNTVTQALPTLTGFSTVDSLSFTTSFSYITNVNLTGIQKINKGFSLFANSIQAFALPDLEEVGGDFYIKQLDRLTGSTLEISKLKKVGGNFTMAVGSASTRSLKFPALVSVGGNFDLATGYTTRSLGTVSFPALETIGNKMTVYGYTSPTSTNANTLLKKLDGFSALKSVKSIEITRQSAIESYEGLASALNSITANGWSATNNAYNPTYEQLKAGQWVKP